MSLPGRRRRSGSVRCRETAPMPEQQTAAAAKPRQWQPWQSCSHATAAPFRWAALHVPLFPNPVSRGQTRSGLRLAGPFSPLRGDGGRSRSTGRACPQPHPPVEHAANTAGIQSCLAANPAQGVRVFLPAWAGDWTSKRQSRSTQQPVRAGISCCAAQNDFKYKA